MSGSVTGIKFGRNYSLTVQGLDDKPITIQPPFTLEFDINRATLSRANASQFRIYNLSQQNRNNLRFNINNYGKYLPITLRAGYGSNLPVIFTGNVTQAWSVREGVNYITQLECYDGGYSFVNGVANLQVAAGTPQTTVIEQLMEFLPHVTIGGIGNFSGVTVRGNTYTGNVADILRELTGGAFFIDNQVANALGTSEYLSEANAVTVINSKSGLLGTPVLEQNIVRFDMIFEPGVVPGQKVLLESITGLNFNGEYKITGIKHKGMISETVCGEAITSGEFFYVNPLTPVEKIS